MVVTQGEIKREKNQTRKECDVEDKFESLGQNAAKKNIEPSISESMSHF